MYDGLLRAARGILVLECAAFIYWLVVIGVVTTSHPSAFVESIIAAFHYGATGALYAGMAEIRKAHASGRRDEEVNVSLSNMWIALAVVVLVTDSSGLASAVHGELRDTLSPVHYRMMLSLTAVFVALTVVDLAWLVALRVAIAVDSDAPAIPRVVVAAAAVVTTNEGRRL